MHYLDLVEVLQDHKGKRLQNRKGCKVD